MSNEKYLLEVKNLVKYYPIRGGVLRKVIGYVHAVDNINFRIPRGSTLGLVGESGCGKTTTGRVILRLVDPTSGEIWYNGTNIAKLKEKELREYRKKMQIVFQDPYASLNPRKTIKETLTEPLLVHKIVDNKSDAMEVAFKFLKKVGLNWEHLYRYPHEFSGGQRQRICIARALLLNPEFVVLDEPTSSLDVSVQAQTLNLLKDLQKEFHLTYLFISHNLSVVKHMSDQVAVMYLGKIVEILPSEKLLEKAVHPYTQALVSAIPIPDPSMRKGLKVLPGEVPSAVNPPSGCRFHPRCPYATDKCKVEEPQLIEIEHNHWVACHHPQKNNAQN
ncbi:MAG: peptide ABC transporter substrate-binding protein [Candidatus Asgardarchaeum californiense]|nr:MAG: peptide ABC transporter substrate-binding protein [Candidatus Asgardarchaeum californiense]